MFKLFRQFGQVAQGIPSPEPTTSSPSQLPTPCNPPGRLSLVQEVARTLAVCEGLHYEVPLMAKYGHAQSKPSELRQDLRENLERATTVLMVFRIGPVDEVRGQLREYRQALARYPDRTPRLEICHLGDQPLDLRPSGLDLRVHPVTDGDMGKILEIVLQPPSRERVRGIIEGIIPSVSTKPGSIATLRRMRDERTR